MARIIQPVELHEAEKRIVQDLKKRAKKVSGRNVSVAEIIRRSVRFAGPKFLSGEAPLLEEINIKAERR